MLTAWPRQRLLTIPCEVSKLQQPGGREGPGRRRGSEATKVDATSSAFPPPAVSGSCWPRPASRRDCASPGLAPPPGSSPVPSAGWVNRD